MGISNFRTSDENLQSVFPRSFRYVTKDSKALTPITSRQSPSHEHSQARGFHLWKNTRTIVTISSFQAVVPNTGPQQFYGSFFHRMGAENLPPPAAPEIIHLLNIRRKWVDWMLRTAFIASLCVWGIVLITKQFWGVIGLTSIIRRP